MAYPRRMNVNSRGVVVFSPCQNVGVVPTTTPSTDAVAPGGDDRKMIWIVSGFGRRRGLGRIVGPASLGVAGSTGGDASIGATGAGAASAVVGWVRASELQPAPPINRAAHTAMARAGCTAEFYHIASG